MMLTDKLEPYESAYLGILPSRTGTPATGVAVRLTIADSPAQKAGIDKGHIILKVGDMAVANAGALLDHISRKRPGDKIKLTVKNGDDQREVEIALGSLPNDVPAELPTVAVTGKDNATRPADAPKIGHFTDRLPAHEHDFWAYIPEDYNPDEKYGLVVFLHPANDTMEATLLKAWKPVCERRSLIFVAPKCKELAAGWNPSEAEFVKDLTEEFLQKYSIDKSRVVIHGFGTGGTFALHTAFKHRELFRGAAIVGAAAREAPPDNDPEHRIQFHFATGESDPTHGGVVVTVTVLRSMKFPVVHTIAEFGEHKYPTGEHLDALGRWIDMLDRI
jgi:predicted esterase